MDNYNTKRDGVGVKILETGEVFNSIQACANYLGVNGSWLRHVVNGDLGYRTCRGFHVVRLNDARTIGEIDRLDRRGRPGRRIRIVETGEIFNSISDCAKAINGSAGTIHDVLHNNRNRTSYRGLHFEFVD